MTDNLTANMRLQSNLEFAKDRIRDLEAQLVVLAQLSAAQGAQIKNYEERLAKFEQTLAQDAAEEM